MRLVLHLAFIFITFAVGITFAVVIAFSGDTPGPDFFVIVTRCLYKYSAVCKSLGYIYPVLLKENRGIKISLFRRFAVSLFRGLVTPMHSYAVFGKFRFW